jgi:hypothetical protein
MFATAKLSRNLSRDLAAITTSGSAWASRNQYVTGRKQQIVKKEICSFKQGVTADVHSETAKIRGFI